MAETIEHFFIYSVLPKIIESWLIRRPIANEKEVVKISKPIYRGAFHGRVHEE